MTKDRDLELDSGLVRALAALLAETGLSEIEYAVGDRRIRVARNLAPAAFAAPALAPAQPAAGGEARAAPAPAEHPGAVKSPMVGTVYLAPQPDSPPFVRVGDPVAEGQILLIIEAMKVMNQIQSPRAGRLARILVEDGAPVEYGQALMVSE
jgi:acetyl-CoA carboxylase biotin carboxyl carrier protein